METAQKKHIAVLGAGVAGIVAAYLLSRKHDVTLFEKNDYIGGHTRTVSVPDKEHGAIPVDVGFMMFNDRTYPLFTRFVEQLGVETGKTDLSFSYTDVNNSLHYEQKDFQNFLSREDSESDAPGEELFSGILRFAEKTRLRLHNGSLAGLSMKDYLASEAVGESVVKNFVMPLVGAVLSATEANIYGYPAEAFARYYENHGLLDLTDPCRWMYVEGGGHAYIRAFLKIFAGRVFPSGAVENIFRTSQGILIKMQSYVERFDKVVLATHADEALKMLAEPTEGEKRLLSVWNYKPGKVILHRDESFLPPDPGVRTAWNFLRTATAKINAPAMLTYDMTLLQNLPTSERICVTLNPWKHVAPEKVIREMTFDHPMFSLQALKLQQELALLNGRENTYFCGSYFGAGFHEDSVRSAVEVGKQFGIEL